MMQAQSLYKSRHPMTKRIHFLIAVLILSGLTGTASLHAQTAQQEVAADAFISALIERAWDRVEALEHPTLLEKITREQWTQLIDELETKAGKIQRHMFHSAEANGSYASIVHRLYFEKDSIGVRMVVDSLNLVGGFWLDPIKKEYAFAPPSYADTNSFTEKHTSIGEAYPLPAVISIPKGDGPFPAVVLVHGSGANDMDQTVMVLRYEKRTRAYARKMHLLTLTIQEETIDDALIALATLRAHPAADTTRLILLGHSLGASVAPEIAAQMPSVDGVIMLAPIARPLEDVIADQLRFIASQQDTLRPSEEVKLRNELEKSRQIAKEELMKSKMLLGMPASYFYDLHRRDQKSYALKLTVPMYIARGDKDYQAPQMEMLLWQQWLEEKDNVTYRTYPDAFHLFIRTDASPGPWNYQQVGHVMPELINDLAAWCRSIGGAPDRDGDAR